MVWGVKGPGQVEGREAGKPGRREAGKPGSLDPRIPGSREARKPGCRGAGKPGYPEAGKPGSRIQILASPNEPKPDLGFPNELKANSWLPK